MRDKLKALHAELDRGLRTSSAYTVQRAVADWLEGGLPGRTDRTRSVYQEAVTPLLQHIGAKPLKDLTAGDVRAGLEALSSSLSTRYLQIAKASLTRAIRYAEAHDRRPERGYAAGIRPESRSAFVTHPPLTGDPGLAGIDSLAGSAVIWLMILERMQHLRGAQEGPASRSRWYSSVIAPGGR